jgi:hypothetical protein
VSLLIVLKTSSAGGWGDRRWRKCAVGGAATTETWSMVGCYGRQCNVSLLCKYCLGPECISFQICIFFPNANGHDNYFSATPVSG